MIVGAYILDLYCDAKDWNEKPHTWKEFPHEFTGEYGTRCRREARRAGWVLKRNGEALCPKCSGKKG